MLKITKKGDKYWLFEDSEIGLFSPSKFTINLELNEIVIVYENGLKSKRYNVSDCEIYDLGATSPFTTSNGDLFMQKLEELNCPCFQKNENIFNISGGAWGDITGTLSDQTDLQNALDLKLDKVSTAGVERAYIINADGSQGTKATSEFGGVAENDLYRSFFQYSARNDAAGIVALNAPVALTTSGTQSLVNISGVSKYASIPLQNYLSATPNGSNCGWKQGTLADGVIRQGFDIYMIWANNDANSNCQTLVGSYSLTAAIPNLAVSSFTGDFFGVSNDVGDTNLSFYAHRVTASFQTASYTKVATNSNFPAHDTTSAYMLRMEAPCTEVEADRYIKMTLINIITGATISHTFPYTETPVLNRVVLCVINRNNRNTGVATNIRPSKIHYSRLIY